MNGLGVMRPVPVAFRMFRGRSAERLPTVFLACIRPEGSVQPERSERPETWGFGSRTTINPERNVRNAPRSRRGTRGTPSIREVVDGRP